ncbi:MAG: sulfatase-like hydrolase/transferase [Blastochloris sp.]|nr:sulfatase-like hydrolase/transferase [Blastochloris sp.]
MKNILLIICDQLSAQALSAYGNTDSRTPHLDALMARGTRFATAFSNCPLCMPSRASFWTGRYPHQTGVLSNGREFPVTPISSDVPTLGSIFFAAGYQTVHFGKCHDAGTLRGFDCAEIARVPVEATDPTLPVNYDTEQDRDATNKIITWLARDESRPFFAVADLNNPHDICNWIGRFEHDPIPPISDPLPALPTNLHRAEGEFERLPLPVQYLCCAHNRQAQIAEWDEHKIRHYLRAYLHYVSRADAEIGRILAALNARADAAETLIVFMADHGDSMGGRWMATKHCTFYEETVRVPLVFAGPGIAGSGRVAEGLVSLLDLFPTLCDYAGLPIPPGLGGASLLPQLRGEVVAPREYVAAEWHTEWGFTIEPGRMIRTPHHKYTHYLESNGEELYDLHSDPGELRNLATDPAHITVLETHRQILREHAARTGDGYFNLTWKAAPRWRSHTPGYRHHRGPTAPMEVSSR